MEDMEIMNKPAMGFYGAHYPKQAPFLWSSPGIRRNQKTRTLMGPIALADYAGSEGSRTPSHGLPRFESASFDAAYPFGTVNLEDADMPVSARALYSILLFPAMQMPAESHCHHPL